jgi:hypothetical protein
MTEEQKATAQRVIDRLIAKRKVYDIPPELKTKTPAEINAPADSVGKATPASFISPYYGEQFNNEVKKAKFENTKLKVLTNESYPALFEEIPYEKKGRSSAYYTPVQEKVKVPSVTLTGPEGQAVRKENAAIFKEGLTKPKDSLEYKDAKEYIESNAYGSTEDYADTSGTAEHEFGHHYAKPSPELKNKIGGKFGGELGEQYLIKQTHIAKPDEVVNALGRLQRETFKATGKRYDSEGFKKLIQSGETPDYLTPEGRRVINHMRFQFKDRENSKSEADKYLETVSKLIPALVKNEEPKSFEDAVNQRMS